MFFGNRHIVGNQSAADRDENVTHLLDTTKVDLQCADQRSHASDASPIAAMESERFNSEIELRPIETIAEIWPATNTIAT